MSDNILSPKDMASALRSLADELEQPNSKEIVLYCYDHIVKIFDEEKMGRTLLISNVHKKYLESADSELQRIGFHY